MKRLLALLLSAAMLVCVAACGDAEDTTSSEDPDNQVSSETQSPWDPNKMDIKDVDNDGVIRVACVGDSITAGSDPITYPNYLQEYLNFLSAGSFATEAGSVKYEVKNHGKGGAAVRDEPENVGSRFYYDDPLYTSSLTYTPDVVIVQMGTNDGAYDNLANADTYFKADYYTYFIKPYVEKGSLLVLATPPTASNGIHNDGVNGKISTLVRELATEYSLPLVDTNALTTGRDESFPDGLHGNASGYSLLAQIYYNKVFGGNLWSLTVKTQPGAVVTCDIHMAVADASGVAKLTTLDYQASRNFNLKVTCKDFKVYSDSIIVNSDMTLTCNLTPGLYDVTGNANAIADSTTGDNVAQLAVDGNDSTRWESSYKDGCWLLVDLGETKSVNGVSIVWEGAYAKEYDIEVSVDGQTFTKVASVTIGREGEEITSFDPVETRYIRVNCKARATKYGSSIYEFKALSDVK